MAPSRREVHRRQKQIPHVDGTKVRANASKASFKTGAKLMEIEAKVAERLAKLKAELNDDREASSRRRGAARDWATRARKALDQIKAEKAERAKRHAKDKAKKSEAKASILMPRHEACAFRTGRSARPTMLRSRWRPGRASLYLWA